MLPLLALVFCVAPTGANITGQHPATGTCLCVTKIDVNVHSAPGVKCTVTGSVSRPECYTFRGGILTTDGYTWYELQNVHDGNGWVAGIYLDIGSASNCTNGSSSSGAGSCNDTEAQDYACTLLAKADARELTLWNRHPSGVCDNAYAYNNIRDTCNGQAASRSNYTCSECSSPGAPGGHVCLKASLLKYILGVHKTLGAIHVNEIAGGCHSCTSKHYDGAAVDLHNPTYALSMTMLWACICDGGRGQDEGNHFHCQFNASAATITTNQTHCPGTSTTPAR